MLIKDDELARKRIGQQVIYGMAEGYELYLFPDIVNENEPAYVVCATVNEATGKVDGIAKPWSTLVLDYQRRGNIKSDIYTMFPDLIGKMELVYFKNKLYALSRFNKEDFVIIGASVMTFASMGEYGITFSGVTKTEELKELDNIKLLR